MNKSWPLCAAWLFCIASAVQAAYPDKPIHYVIPFPPGTDPDKAARLQQAHFQKKVGQRLIITTLPGAAGTIGWHIASKSKGDGYTLVSTSLPDVVTQPLQGKGRYKADDLQPVFIDHYAPDVLVVHASGPYKSYSDWLKAAKAGAGKFSVGTIADNGAGQLACERLTEGAGIELSCTASRNSADLAKALSAGSLLAAVTDLPTAMTVKSGMRILAIAMDRRHDAYPDVPTFKELGITWVDGTYRAIAVPASTPQAMQKMISGWFTQINSDAGYQKAMAAAGFVISPIPLEKIPSFMADKSKDYKTLSRNLGLSK